MLSSNKQRARSALFDQIKAKFTPQQRRSLFPGKKWSHATNDELRQVLGIKPIGSQKKKSAATTRFQHKQTAERISKLAPGVEQKLGGREQVLKAIKKAVDKARASARKDGREASNRELQVATLAALRSSVGRLKNQRDKSSDSTSNKNARHSTGTFTHEAGSKSLLPETRQRQTTEFAKKWSHSFNNAPNDLKAVISRFDEPKELTDEATTAYFRPGTQGGINMDGHVNPKDSFNQAVYRHEYGHYLDRELGSAIINLTIKKLGLSSVPNISDKSADNYKNLQAIQDELGIGNTAIETGFISSFPAGKEAAFNDGMKLTQQTKRAESIYIKTFNRLNKSIKYGSIVGIELGGVEPTQELKIAIGRKLAIQEIDDKINEASHIAASNEPLHKQFQKRREYYYLEFDKTLLNKKDVYGQIYRRLKDSPARATVLLALAPKLIVASKTKDPDLLASIADKVFDTGNVQDLIGSITANRVGKGHSNEYYQGPQGVINRHTEAFANLTDLHGRGDVLASRVANTLVSHTYNFFKEAINAK